MSGIEELPLATQKSRDFLNERQLEDYRSHRRNCLRWLLNLGKNPRHVEGYAFETVRARSNRMDMFYRWVWNHEDRYIATPTTDHAEEYLNHLAYRDTSNADKANHQKAVQMLLKWREHEHGLEPWEPSMTFSSSDSASQPNDFFTQEERQRLREASLEYGSVPGYSDLSPSARDRWRQHLAQRFEKPKEDVVPADWERANDWKIPSLVATSLDTGLRPIEVARAKTYWVDLDNDVLRIPSSESSKNSENWVVSLLARTTEMLGRWLAQRETYSNYQNTDALWLTREGNPYRSQALKHLLHGLCEVADIDTSNRQASWYTIRHSVGTYMAREEGLAAAQAQLRHKSVQTTMKYDQAPVEDRRSALDRMG